MLSKEHNELVTQTAPGTPMGDLMRQYWIPAAKSSELTKDGDPVRIKLLGEELIAFRDTSGKVGIMDHRCPHRCASMFFGRNEEGGIRCVYHGWKFDADGNCTDLPTEPATSKMKDHIKIDAYPTVERGGLVWAYLGPKDQMPEPPNYEWMRAPATHRHVSKTFEHCNWLQALEGGLDTAHSSYLHNNKLGDTSQLRNRDRAPRIDVEPTDYGYRYVSQRKAGADGRYVRVYQYIMPTQQMRGAVARTSQRRDHAVSSIDGHIWVPIDDEHTYVYNWACGYDSSVILDPEHMAEREHFYGRGPQDLIPGTFKLKRNKSNDYLIDRNYNQDEYRVLSNVR